jgi:hypothetical protein
MEELTADYVSGALQPGDLKLALANSLKIILQVNYSLLPGSHLSCICL